MAVAGELPDQPSWALALWNGLLLLALDGWGDNSIPLAGSLNDLMSSFMVLPLVTVLSLSP